MFGTFVNHANLDHAATTPCLVEVRKAVDELLPWYASVHRGAGFAAQVCSSAYESARDVVRDFTGAGPDAAVLFTRNTTDAMNLLARSLPVDTTVLRFDTEHHAALLPWNSVRRLGFPRSPAAAIAALTTTLEEVSGPALVVLTGASNVTGELWPIEELAHVARKHGARIVLDAAQLAPHRPLEMQRWQIDWVAFSGHKLYAPFGAGTLVGSPDWIAQADPYLRGGGATKHVTDLHGEILVDWATLPARHEAGTPNLIGVHALATACRVLTESGWDGVMDHERRMVARLREGLASIPGVRQLALFDEDHPRVAVVSFMIDGMKPSLVAAALSAEHGISLRDGAFCAHLATQELLGPSPEGPRCALRVSVGLGTTPEHVERFLTALDSLVRQGPAWAYEEVGGRWTPTPDPRPMPHI